MIEHNRWVVVWSRPFLAEKSTQYWHHLWCKIITTALDEANLLTMTNLVVSYTMVFLGGDG